MVRGMTKCSNCQNTVIIKHVNICRHDGNMCGSLAAFSALVATMGDGDFVLTPHKAAPRLKTEIILAAEEGSDGLDKKDTICHTTWAIEEIGNAKVRGSN